MTMQGMVDYLTERGFKATKEYDTKSRSYRFEIEKHDYHLVRYFKYIHGEQSWRHQKDFLEAMVKEFNEGIRKELKMISIDDMRTYLLQHGCRVVTTDSRNHHGQYEVQFDVARNGNRVVRILNEYDIGGFTEIQLHRREFIQEILDYLDRLDAKTLDVETLYPSSMIEYAKFDTEYTKQMLNRLYGTKAVGGIENVIVNNPATIVFWADGTKTVVKAQDEIFDPEKGLAMAIAKKALGNDHGYYETFKKWIGKYNKSLKKKAVGIIDIFPGQEDK